VVVASVEPGGPAADAGLVRGDIIHEANHETIESLAGLESAIGRVPKGGRLLLRIELLYVPVQLD
jgi:S1-C subfamily serine protease